MENVDLKNETPTFGNVLLADSLPIDVEKYPYHGICGKCENYRNKLDKHCLCQTCYQFGVRKLGGMIPDEIFKFVKPRF
jgi:hypothetical protein